MHSCSSTVSGTFSAASISSEILSSGLGSTISKISKSRLSRRSHGLHLYLLRFELKPFLAQHRKLHQCVSEIPERPFMAESIAKAVLRGNRVDGAYEFLHPSKLDAAFNSVD